MTHCIEIWNITPGCKWDEVSTYHKLRVFKTGCYLRAQCKDVWAHSRHCALNRVRHILLVHIRDAPDIGHYHILLMGDSHITAYFTIFWQYFHWLISLYLIMADQCVTGSFNILHILSIGLYYGLLFTRVECVKQALKRVATVRHSYQQW